MDTKKHMLVGATNDNNVEAVRAALKLGADPDTALITACRVKHIEIIEILLDAGADINKHAAHCATPLTTAARSHSADTVRCLIQRGANVSLAERTFDTTALHAVCMTAPESDSSCSDREIIEILLNAGANINVKDSHGNTPLICAAYFGNLEIMTALIKNGADINRKNNDGETALDFLKSKHSERYDRWIREHILRQEDTAVEAGSSCEPDFDI